MEATTVSETFGYCKSCQLILFSRGFLQRAQPAPTLSKAARRSVAIVSAAAMADRGKETVADSPPEFGKKAVSYLGMLLTGGIWGGFGLPFESGGKMLRRAPWATWSLCAVVGFLSWRAFGDLDDAAARFGVIPAEAARNLGGRFVTSFFVHEGWLHLLPNLYFLAVFGSNVEDSLGIGRFLLVVFLANLAGDFMHVTFHPDSEVALVGSSPGISGLMAYSALRHPRRKVGMLCWIWPFWRILWIRLSLRVAFFLWLGWEIFRVNAGTIERGDASPWMHLGGISAGVFFWAIWTEHEVPSRWRDEG